MHEMLQWHTVTMTITVIGCGKKQGASLAQSSSFNTTNPCQGNNRFRASQDDTRIANKELAIEEEAKKGFYFTNIHVDLRMPCFSKNF